jgi:hypothetical protein
MFRIAQWYKNQARLDLLGALEEGRLTIRLINPRHLNLVGLEREITFDVPSNNCSSRLSIFDYLFNVVQEKFSA